MRPMQAWSGSAARRWISWMFSGPPLFLGLLEGTAHFVVDVSQVEGTARELDPNGGYRYVDARSATELLDAASCGIVAQARAQVDWHARNGFCPRCGSTTTMARGGQTRHCPGCDAIHLPRAQTRW